MKNKNLIGIALIAGIVILAIIGSTFSVTDFGSYGVDAMGNLIVPGGSSFQALSLYDQGGESHECFIDDSRNAGCIVQKDTLSVPEGAQIVHHIDRSVDYVGGTSGWEGYESCIGFMTHYGCTAKECAYHNGGVCVGLNTDGSGIECGTNTDCYKKYGTQDYSCMYGKCQLRDVNIDYLYKCYKGQIYVAVNGIYKMYGSCMDKYSVSKCKGGYDEVNGNDPREVCQADCVSDADCKIGYVCQKVRYTVDGSSNVEEGGRCVIPEAKTQEDVVFQKQEDLRIELQQKATACTADGGEWTGTDCVDRSADEQILGEYGAEEIFDYLLTTCSDGVDIWYSEYMDGARCSDGNTPNPWLNLNKSSNKIFIAGGVVLIIAAIGYFMFGNGRVKRR